MICVIVRGPTYEEAHQQILKALPYADLVELRLDYFASLDIASLTHLRSVFSIPLIFTLRSQIYGGHYTHSEDSRIDVIRRLIDLKPEYIDLESHVPSAFMEEIYAQYPEIKMILSYHNFSETPDDDELEDIFTKMQMTPASFYKIAVTGKNSLDALRFVCWAKSRQKLIPISMGIHGQISRILGPIIGCPITYAALEEDQVTATGQLTAETLIERYRHRSLNSNTKIFGLIGNPVQQSLSDKVHNSQYSSCNLDAVYIKMQLNPEELPPFLEYAKELPFHGMSVTMPLKEYVIPLLNDIDSRALEIGAVNTLLFENKKICGYNTDSIGALNAIEQDDSVDGKRIVILGAGGAAKAIAYEAHLRGGLVTILNRDAEKAVNLAKRINCVGNGLEAMKNCFENGYDILINCTPVAQPISAEYIIPGSIVMDIMTIPVMTEFLKMASEKDCHIIYGYRMFIEQALGQFALWYGDSYDLGQGRKIMERKVEELISGERR